MKKVYFLMGLIIAGGAIARAEAPDETVQLRQALEVQQAQIDQQGKLIQRLVQRVATLESEKRSGTARSAVSNESVNLADDEEVPIPDVQDGGMVVPGAVDRVEFSGHGGAGFVWTGDDGGRRSGSYLNYEATLFATAHVMKNIDFFTEMQLLRITDESDTTVRLGEIYIHLQDVLGFWRPDLMNVKLGRIDIPYGEEYLRQDIVDNPLITNSAMHPYNWDEGVRISGQFGRRAGYAAAFMNGTGTRGNDDDTDKMAAIKLFANPVDPLYLSASFLRNGDARTSSMKFGGTGIEPVGLNKFSSLGASRSGKVESYGYELDARYDFGSRAHVWGAFGQVFINDTLAQFDRDFLYFLLEPVLNLTEKWYVASRFSGTGTFDRSEGYHFNGGFYANGVSAFGDDVYAFYRWSIALGYRLNPNAIIKLEFARDDYSLIDLSRLRSNDEREILAAQMAVKF